jgi:competence protein ComEA
LRPVLFEALRRRKEIVAICTVAVAAAALVASLLEDPVYETAATVLVRPQGGAEASADEAIDLAGADEVVAETAKAIGGVDAEYLGERVAIEPGGGPAVFTIQASGNSPAHAALIANTYAEKFVRYADGLGDAFPARAEVAQSANTPDSQASPKTVRNTLIGVGVGFVAGVAIALLWRAFGGRQARPEPATTSSRQEAGPGPEPAEAPTLAEVPELAEATEPVPMPDGPVDLNSVTHEQLRQLGLSTTQAKRLLTYRERNGGFRSVDEIDDVPGFPERQRAELKQRVRV